MCFNSVLGIQMKGRQRGYYLLSQIKFFANVQEFYGVKTGRACGAAAVSPTPGWEDPGEGSGNPLQYSCLENPMERGAWWTTVHGVAKSQKQLSN